MHNWSCLKGTTFINELITIQRIEYWTFCKPPYAPYIHNSMLYVIGLSCCINNCPFLSKPHLWPLYDRAHLVGLKHDTNSFSIPILPNILISVLWWLPYRTTYTFIPSDRKSLTCPTELHITGLHPDSFQSFENSQFERGLRVPGVHMNKGSKKQ